MLSFGEQQRILSQFRHRPSQVAGKSSPDAKGQDPHIVPQRPQPRHERILPDRRQRPDGRADHARVRPRHAPRDHHVGQDVPDGDLPDARDRLGTYQDKDKGGEQRADGSYGTRLQHRSVQGYGQDGRRPIRVAQERQRFKVFQDTQERVGRYHRTSRKHHQVHKGWKTPLQIPLFRNSRRRVAVPRSQLLPVVGQGNLRGHQTQDFKLWKL